MSFGTRTWVRLSVVCTVLFAVGNLQADTRIVNPKAPQKSAKHGSWLPNNSFCRPEARYCKPEVVCAAKPSKPCPRYCKPDVVCFTKPCRPCPRYCKPERVCCNPEPRCCFEQGVKGQRGKGAK